MVAAVAISAASGDTASAQGAIAQFGASIVRGEVTDVNEDNRIQIRRAASLEDDGSPGDPDPSYYPVASPGKLPSVGEWVWGIENNGKPVILGAEPGKGYKDLPAVQAMAEEAKAAAVSSAAIVPIGAIVLYGGVSAPSDPRWLLASGGVYLRTDYPELFTEIGTTWNTGGESGLEFRLPDLRGRVPVQAGGGVGLTSRSVASRFGQEEVVLTELEMPSHGHGGTNPIGSSSHDHSLWAHANDAADSTSQGWPSTGHQSLRTSDRSRDTTLNSAAMGDTSHGHSFDLPVNGSDQPHDNVQPSLGINFVIRAKP